MIAAAPAPASATGRVGNRARIAPGGVPGLSACRPAVNDWTGSAPRILGMAAGVVRTPLQPAAGWALSRPGIRASFGHGAARFGRRTPEPHVRPAAPVPCSHEDGRHEAAMAFWGEFALPVDPDAFGVPLDHLKWFGVDAELDGRHDQARLASPAERPNDPTIVRGCKEARLKAAISNKDVFLFAKDSKRTWHWLNEEDAVSILAQNRTLVGYYTVNGSSFFTTRAYLAMGMDFDLASRLYGPKDLVSKLNGLLSLGSIPARLPAGAAIEMVAKTPFLHPQAHGGIGSIVQPGECFSVYDAQDAIHFRRNGMAETKYQVLLGDEPGFTEYNNDTYGAQLHPGQRLAEIRDIDAELRERLKASIDAGHLECSGRMVRQPCPGQKPLASVESTLKKATTKARGECLAWFMAELAKGRKQTKAAWRAEAKAFQGGRWKNLPDRGWEDIWDQAKAAHPELGKPGAPRRSET